MIPRRSGHSDLGCEVCIYKLSGFLVNPYQYDGSGVDVPVIGAETSGGILVLHRIPVSAIHQLHRRSVIVIQIGAVVRGDNKKVEALAVRGIRISRGRIVVVFRRFIGILLGILDDLVELIVLVLQDAAHSAGNESGGKVSNNPEQEGRDQKRDAKILECRQHSLIPSFFFPYL